MMFLINIIHATLQDSAMDTIYAQEKWIYSVIHFLYYCTNKLVELKRIEGNRACLIVSYACTLKLTLL